MAIWKARVSTGVRVYFAVVTSGGNLRTGLLAGVFTVRIINQTDTAFTSATVTQSTQRAGIYYFDVPSAFITTHGVGHYGLSIGVHAVGPALNDEIVESLEVNTGDIDFVASDVWKVSTATPTAGSYGELVKDNLTALASAIIAADLTAAVGSTSTVINTNATQANGFYDGLQVVITNSSGTVARKIDGYVQASGAITISPALPFTPIAGDNVVILGAIAGAAASVDTTAIAIAVWARSKLSPTGGSYGELVNQIGNNTSIIPALL